MFFNIIISFFSFIIFSFIGLIVTFYISHQRQRKKIAGIPTLKPNPILGNFLQLSKANEEDQVKQWLGYAKKFGKTYAIAGPLKEPVVFVNEPLDIEWILQKNFSNYIKGPEFVELFRPIAGNGIFNVNGSEWKMQRKTASHIFKIKSLRNMLIVFKKHAKSFCKVLENYSKTGEQFDLQDLLYRYTFDSICNIGFGYESNTIETGTSPFSKAFDTIQAMVEIDARYFYRKYLPMSKQNKDALQLLYDKADEIVSANHKDPNIGNKEDLLSLYIKTLTNKDGDLIDKKYLRDVVLNYLIAGRDTTGSTLSFALYFLSKNPHASQQLLDEINQKLFQQNKPLSIDNVVDSINYDDLKQLSFMTNVIQETLRLTPPVPFDPKTVVKDDTLPGSGYDVKAGTTIVWSAYITGRLPEYWKNPDDFNPSRFTDRTVSKYKYLPFQEGYRICLGKQMAMLEMSVVLSVVTKLFKFTTPDDYKLIPVKSVTLRSSGGIPVRVEKKY